MKKFLKITLASILLSTIIAIGLPKLVWASNTIDEEIEEIIEEPAEESTSNDIFRPEIRSAKINEEGFLTLEIYNLVYVSEVRINDKTVEGIKYGNVNYVVVDKSLINTTATISLKYRNGVVTESFYLAAEKDLSFEKTVDNMSSVDKVFTDGDSVYMYSAENRMFRRLEYKAKYGLYLNEFGITDYAIECLLDHKYVLYFEENFKMDNTDFVVINGVIYTYFTFDFEDGREFVLASYDMKSGDEMWQKIDNLPNECKVSMPTLAVYNGNIYLIGGYNEKTNTLSKSVYEYNIKTKKWTKKDNLPGTRYAATANQVGDKLVLSFGGKSDGNVPCNLIFDGNTWKKSAAKINVKTYTGTINNKRYYKPSVGIVSGGLIYSGMDTENFGNIFYYDIETDTFKESGYKANENAKGIAVGNKFYIFESIQNYLNKSIVAKSMPVKTGLARLRVRYPSTGIQAEINAELYSKTKSNDVIYNTYYYMPGDVVELELLDVRGYYYPHFKVDDKEVNGYIYSGPIGAKKEIKITKAKNDTLITLSKKSGNLSLFNQLQLTANITDKNATQVKWKCIPNEYATISSTGLVTPKPKGENNLIYITATTTLYGRSVYAESRIGIIQPVMNNLKQTYYGRTSVSMHWNAIRGADGYEIYISKSVDEQGTLFKKVNTNSITISNLKPLSNYSFRIRAYKTINNKKYYSTNDYITCFTNE